jgi:single-strand DNA-binding protein
MSINKVILLGNLCRDPECKDLGNSTVCNFSIASTERYKDRDGQPKEDTLFIDVQVWGKLTDMVSRYLHKGKPILLEGKLKFDSWEKNGQRNSKHTIVAETIRMLPKYTNKEDSDETQESGTLESGTQESEILKMRNSY